MDIEIITIDDVLYMGMKNDMSFLPVKNNNFISV